MVMENYFGKYTLTSVYSNLRPQHMVEKHLILLNKQSAMLLTFLIDLIVVNLFKYKHMNLVCDQFLAAILNYQLNGKVG